MYEVQAKSFHPLVLEATSASNSSFALYGARERRELRYVYIAKHSIRGSATDPHWEFMA